MKTRNYYVDKNWDLRFECSKCHIAKRFDAFNKSSKWFMWYSEKCRDCSHKINSEHYQKNAQKYIENSYKRKRNNPEKWRQSEKKRRQVHKDEIRTQYTKWREKENAMYWFNSTQLHRRANYFIKKNNLRPVVCPICWINKRIEFHHTKHNSIDDWSIWIFCCKHCHEKIHSWQIKCPDSIDLKTL